MTAELLAPIVTPEVVTETPAVLIAYDQLVSSEACNAFSARIDEGRPLLDIERAAVVEEERDLDNRREALRSGMMADDEVATLQDALSLGYGALTTHEDQLRRHGAFAEERENRWRYGSMLFDRRDPAVAELLEGLSKGAETEEQPFMQDTDFIRMADTSQPEVVIEAGDEPLELPLTAVVSAVAFESWETGRPQHVLKDDRQSAAVIMDYASRETPLPPVDVATALIFEDGKVIIMSSNSHRVGAAKLRGQSTIQIKKLEVRRVKEEQPQETDSECMAVLAVSNTMSMPDTEAEQTEPLEQPIAPNGATRWQNFVSVVNYRRRHGRH
jgi:hypothetical protein